MCVSSHVCRRMRTVLDDVLEEERLGLLGQTPCTMLLQGRAHTTRTVDGWVVEERAIVIGIGAELKDALLAAVLEYEVAPQRLLFVLRRLHWLHPVDRVLQVRVVSTHAREIGWVVEECWKWKRCRCRRCTVEANHSPRLARPTFVHYIEIILICVLARQLWRVENK